MPKIVNHISRRSEIAEAALTAIAEKGLENVRMIDIARACNATTGTVVHYFPDKDAVILAAMEGLVTNTIANMQKPGFKNYLMRGLYVSLPITAEAKRRWRLWLQFLGRAMVLRGPADLHKWYYGQISAGLAEVFQSAGGKGDLRSLADAVVAAIDGIGVRATVEPKSWTAERQRSLLRKMVLPLFKAAGLETEKT